MATPDYVVAGAVALVNETAPEPPGPGGSGPSIEWPE